MTLPRCVCLVLLLAGFLVASSPVASRPAHAEVGRIERTPEFVRAVNASIDRGVAFLRKTQLREGGWPDYPGYGPATTAFAYHTLRACGVAATDPAMQRGYAALKLEWGGYPPALRQTYTIALVMMAVAEHGRRLPTPDGERTTDLEPADEAWMREMVAALERRQSSEGTWGYLGASSRADRTDNSNTQYALLGLKAAARCGVAVKGSTWRTALQHFVSSQDTTGPAAFAGPEMTSRKGTTRSRPTDASRGWGYSEGGASYGSMTAGGVGSVVICRSELLGTSAMPAGLDAKSEKAIRDGLAWLGMHFSVRTNPGPPSTMAGAGWYLYYLYAVERAGVLAGVDWMGDRDWYGEGAAHLMTLQKPDGAWVQDEGFSGVKGEAVRTPHDVVIHTCFALLFLRKGTIPVRRGALTKSAEDADIRFDGAADLGVKDFDDLVDLVLQRWTRTTDPDVKTRLFDRMTAVGPRIVAPLLQRMSSDDESDRTAAHELLRRATGESFAYDPTSPRDLREDAILAWQSWWLGRENTLKYDAAARLLK